MHRERPKSWFQKNWWWSIPSCCLGCAGLMVGSCALLVGGVFTAFRSSAPFEEALERARAHPAAVMALGEPMDTGWAIQGQFNTENGRTVADFTVPISGPVDEGLLRVKGERQAGTWEFEVLEIELEDGSIIDLLAPPSDHADPSSET